MSVQAGIWNFDQEPASKNLLVTISRELVEYGPDGETTLFDGPVGMLYRPFYTTSEARFEHQPHVSAVGTIIMWDGRLDNREELISALSHDMSEDRSDVAIVGAAFDRWNTNCFPKLIGDWALTVWDPHERKLILARDYIGIRNLFYCAKAEKILWCSHLGPLVSSGGTFTLCDEYIAGYLASWPDADLTPYQQIKAVPPGQFVQIRNNKIATHTYWTLNTSLRTCYKSDAEYEEHYRHLFRQAVRRRLRTDSPILADLSGGLDSSSIVCMADDILLKEKIECPRVDTFSFYDSTEPEDDDLLYFPKVEEKRGKIGFHAHLRASGESLALYYQKFDPCPRIQHRLEPRAALAEILGRHEYTVQLSGAAGDDVNGQGLDPRIQLADLMLQFRFVELSKQITAWSLLIRKRPWIHIFFQTLLQFMPVSIRARFTEYGKLDPWVDRRFAKRYRMSARQMDAVKGTRLLRPSTRNAVQTIASLSREMSYLAPSSVEVRYPYLDQNLVEFLKTIPLEQLLRPGQRRSLMRRALADLLPPEVLTRKTKAAPGRCYSVALEKQWDKVESVFSSPISARVGYLDAKGIREALAATKNGDVATFILRLLRALSLELWLRDAEYRGVLSNQRSTPSVGEHLLLKSQG